MLMIPLSFMKVTLNVYNFKNDFSQIYVDLSFRSPERFYSGQNFMFMIHRSASMIPALYDA